MDRLCTAPNIVFRYLCISGNSKVSGHRYTPRNQSEETLVPTKLYSSFLLRCWCSKALGGAESFKLEHIQSGEIVRVASLKEALEWVEERAQQVSSDRKGRAEP
jgi:hypothetical protein